MGDRDIADIQNTDGTEKVSYHHGNLRDALIVAAAELIEERTSTDFTMVDAARRAGVSSAAPYRHFKDRRALLAAVRHVAFMGLTKTLHQISANVDPGTENGIIAIARGYVEFVTGHPEFYSLMWGNPGSRANESGADGVENSCFSVLVDAVSQWSNRNGLGRHDESELAARLWAMAHGLASLELTHALGTILPNTDVHLLLDSTIRTFLTGLTHEYEAISSRA